MDDNVILGRILVEMKDYSKIFEILGWRLVELVYIKFQKEDPPLDPLPSSFGGHPSLTATSVSLGAG